MGRLTVGRYELLEELGRGGMATVWLAATPDGGQVALKLVDADRPAETLRLEIATVARLCHPNIVRIIDWGELTATASEVSVPDGSPWFAMELGDRGCVSRDAIKSWEDLRTFVLSVLEALMYAHARGVIHRDIKPENVLCTSRAPHYVLSDFGIAFRRSTYRQSTAEVRYAAAGTIVYMAPEQLLGHWRDFGPYTDLFSLGAVIYELATGRLPFGGASRVAIAMQHASGPPPLGPTRFAVPDGFEAWLARLLAHDPRDRYAFAADAAVGLLELGELVSTEVSNVVALCASSTTLPMGWLNDTVLSGPPTPRSQPALHIGGPRAPVCDDWRAGQPEPPHAVGLEMFARGRVGVVGRESERDVLWDQLVACATDRRARAVVLTGQPGLGATTLATWLCERAAEVATADYVMVRRRNGSSGVPEAVTHTLGLGGLEPRHRLERIRSLFPEADAELVDLVATGAPLPIEDDRFAIEQLLRSASAQRPLIVFVDDAHHSLSLIELAFHLVGHALRVLFVLTVDETELAAAPFETERLDELLASEGCKRLELTPMPDDDLRSLVNAVAELDDGARAAICRAAGGNPLIATNLLELHAAGSVDFTDLDSLWRQRLDSLGGNEDVRAVLLAAAVLGEAVDEERLHDLCDAAGLDLPTRIFERFLAAHLWTVARDGFRFVHGSLRRHLLRDPGARALHRLAAPLFDESYAPAHAPRARHLIGGGDISGAAWATLDAVRILASSQGRFREAMSLSTWLVSALDGFPEAQEARLVARLCVSLSDDEADLHERLATNLELAADAEQAGLLGVASRATKLVQDVKEALGDRPGALEAAERAYSLARGGRSPSAVARAAMGIAWTRYRSGDLEGAARAFQIAGDSGYQPALAAALEGVAYCRIEMGDRVGAEEALAEAVRAHPSRLQLGRLHTALGDVALLRSDYATARKHFSRSYHIVNRSRPLQGLSARLNLVITEVLAGDDVRAAELLDSTPHHPDPWYQALADLLRCVIAALHNDPELWNANFHPDKFEPHVGLTFTQLWNRAANAWTSHDRSDLAVLAVQRAATAESPHPI